MPISAGDVERVFRDAGAFRDGHFILASGKHSPRYLEKFQVLQWPRQTERLCAEIAQQARALDVATVAGPTTGGIILAHEVARQLGTRAIYAERDDDGLRRVFRRGFQIAPAERVLVVDDIMSTGGSVQETIEAVTSAGGSVAGAGVLVDRSGGTAAPAGMPLIALWRLDVPAFEPAECPQCADGVPAVKPGTTRAPGVSQ